ncbi:uncharacterized protein LOC125228779 [Leguminivora glycinivorella]|uniref:uncharacterized protein LOC125228779 n=1 Tax=Leguminivora glycinivorella TaxID=1035111 RepID=UPI00200DEBD6|nr:uncharacterized protein LOC125228779 [Leguminivora glycinivorella]
MMIRNLRRIPLKQNYCLFIQKHTFLTNDYQCNGAWSAQVSASVLSKVNLHDFFNTVDQNYSTKGVISAIDVDVFANSIKEPVYLDELKELLHKLRLSAETGNTLESTHHATIRNYIEFGNIEDLVKILQDPLNFGVFLDAYTANILLNKLITAQNYEQAANVASLVMLQEDFSNEITCTLCQYACYKYISGYIPPEPTPPEEKPKKVEEVKIRIKYLRNPYFDDHFDIKDTLIASGKTLAWISEKSSDNLNNNLQIIGLLVYKKYDKLLALCEKLSKSSFKAYAEVLEVLKKGSETDAEAKPTLEQCISVLSSVGTVETSLEDSLKIAIENAINKNQNKDIASQEQLFKSWVEIRENKLQEQTKRLDRAKRLEFIQKSQNQMAEEEQKLWFFENEEKIDLQIEEKEKLEDKSVTKKEALEKSDENYIPPEILPKRR